MIKFKIKTDNHSQLITTNRFLRIRHQIPIDQLVHRAQGFFTGRELYFFDPSGNRLELRDPTWHEGMPEPDLEELSAL